jgi:hypothetical protein
MIANARERPSSLLTDVSKVGSDRRQDGRAVAASLMIVSQRSGTELRSISFKLGRALESPIGDQETPRL